MLDTTQLVELAVADRHRHVDVPHVESPWARRRHRVVHPFVDARGATLDRIRQSIREPGRARERVPIRVRSLGRIREIAGSQPGEPRCGFLVLRPERFRGSGREGMEFLSVVRREPPGPPRSHLFDGDSGEDDARTHPLGEQRGTGERARPTAGPAGDEERRRPEMVGQGGGVDASWATVRPSLRVEPPYPAREYDAVAIPRASATAVTWGNNAAALDVPTWKMSHPEGSTGPVRQNSNEWPSASRSDSMSTLRASLEQVSYVMGSSTNTGICRSVFVWYFA